MYLFVTVGNLNPQKEKIYAALNFFQAIMMRIYVLSLLIFFFLFSCYAEAKKNNETESAAYRLLAREKYGLAARYLFNDSHSHVICYKSSKPDIKNPIRQLSYFIYDIKNGNMLQEASLSAGKIRWLDDTRLEIEEIPGMVKKSAEPGTQVSVIDISKIK